MLELAADAVLADALDLTAPDRAAFRKMIGDVHVIAAIFEVWEA